MIFRRETIPFLILIVVFAVGKADISYAAQKFKKLTESNITEFIETTSSLTSGYGIEIEESDLQQYLETHLDEEARFKSTVQFNIPGFPPQKKSLSLDKKDFMTQVAEGTKSIEHYENKVKVEKVRISKDGTKATVETSGFEEGFMPVSLDGATTQDVPIEGVSECLQIIKLSDKGVIQMYSANCTTNIQFKEY